MVDHGRSTDLPQVHPISPYFTLNGRKRWAKTQKNKEPYAWTRMPFCLQKSSKEMRSWKGWSMMKHDQIEKNTPTIRIYSNIKLQLDLAPASQSNSKTRTALGFKSWYFMGCISIWFTVGMGRPCSFSASKCWTPKLETPMERILPCFCMWIRASQVSTIFPGVEDAKLCISQSKRQQNLSVEPNFKTSDSDSSGKHDFECPSTNEYRNLLRFCSLLPVFGEWMRYKSKYSTFIHRTGSKGSITWDSHEKSSELISNASLVLALNQRSSRTSPHECLIWEKLGPSGSSQDISWFCGTSAGCNQSSSWVHPGLKRGSKNLNCTANKGTQPSCRPLLQFWPIPKWYG